MCLGVPMQIITVTGESATAELDGVQSRVSLRLVGPVQAGDYVLVHAGYAIEVMNAQAAEETIGYFREIAQKTGLSAED